MAQIADTLDSLARGGAALLRIPTAIVVGFASVVVILFGLQVWALLAGADPPGWIGAGVALALLVLMAVPVAVFAVRRRRWLRRTQPTERGPVVIQTGAELITVDSLGDRIEDQMRDHADAEDVQAVMDAFTEIQLPATSRRGAGARMTRMFGVGRLAVIGRVFGRMERAQRALLTAAGGPVRAPYLVDDLRVTVASFVGTLGVIWVGILANLVLAIILIAR